MKKFLILSFLFIMSACVTEKTTFQKQEDHLNPVLYKIQNQYGFVDTWVDLRVLSQETMKSHSAWGDSFCDEKGCHIEILYAEGYPKNFPKNKIQDHQEVVLMHEFLHLFFTRLSVPDDFQDGLILSIQPHLEKVK